MTVLTDYNNMVQNRIPATPNPRLVSPHEANRTEHRSTFVADPRKFHKSAELWVIQNFDTYA